MRRFVLVTLAIAGTAAVATFAAIQHGKSCAPSASPARGAIVGNFDPAMSGVCRFSCATRLKHKAADVVMQPGAESGRLTQCPVSGVVFVVDDSRPVVRVAGHAYVACCGNCAEKLRHDPHHYLKA